MKPPRSAALYARISSDQDGTRLGVDRQIEDCKKSAEQWGWPVGGEYVDNDLSASSYSRKRRPAYDRMLQDLRDGARDAVIVYHVDRLTRRPLELEQFLEAVTAAGVHHVRFVNGPADISTGDGLMVLRMLSAFAANESATKSRRIKRKIEQNVAEGLPNGGAVRPFGYAADRMTIIEAEAVIIRQLVARYINGESVRSLTAWLQAQEVPTVTGSAWREHTVRTILRSPRHAGLREHLGRVVGPAAWEPIISEDEHRRVLAAHAQRSLSGRRAPRRYLLSGLLRCGKCGKPLYSAARQTTRRYVCLSGGDKLGCGKLTVVAAPVEELVAAGALYRLDTPALADALTGKLAADEQTAALLRQLDADRTQLDELATVAAQRLITTREWLLVRAPVETRVRDAERRLSALSAADALPGLIGQGAALRAAWDTLNLDRQAAVVTAVLDHAVIAAGKPGSRSLDPTRVQPVWRL